MRFSQPGMLLAGVETTYATAATLTGANYIAVSSPTVDIEIDGTPLDFKWLDGKQNMIRGHMTMPKIKFTFEVDLRGNRTNGSADDISKGAIAQAIPLDPLFRGCDMAATYTAETTPGARNGNVTYRPTPPTTDQGTGLTLAFYSGGKKYVGVGCKGNLSGTFSAGKPGRVKFDYFGLYVAASAVTDAAFLTPTILETIPPLNGGGADIGLSGLVVRDLTWDLGNEVIYRENANNTEHSFAGLAIVRRDTKGTASIESELLAVNPVYAAWRNRSDFVLGVGWEPATGPSGNSIALLANACIDKVKTADSNGILIDTINWSQREYTPAAAAGAPNFYLTFS